MLKDRYTSEEQKKLEESLKIVSRDEVDNHSRPGDMWIVIDNLVYDLTKFQTRHPGGKTVLQHNAGKDATEAWILAGHSPKAREQMKEFVIAKVDPNEVCTSENPA